MPPFSIYSAVIQKDYGNKMAQKFTQPVTITLDQPIRPPFGAEKRVPLQNMVVTRDGGRKQRGGQDRHMSSAITGATVVNGVHDFQLGDTQKLVVSAGGKILKEDNFDGAFDDITQAGLAWSSTAPTSTIVMNSIIGIWNRNGDDAQKWNQTDVTTSDLGATNATTAAFAVAYRGVGFAAGVAATIDTLYYSAVGDIDGTFSALNIGLGDGLGGITGFIGHPNPNVNFGIVFKERGIYALDMPNISSAGGWTVRELTGTDLRLGCPSFHTIKAVPVPNGPDVWFLGNDGQLYSLNRLIETQDLQLASISFPYSTSFDEIKKSRLENTVAQVDTEGEQYCLFASVDATDKNDRMFTASYRVGGELKGRKGWFPECQIHPGVEAASVGTVKIKNRQRIVTGGYNGFLDRQFGSNLTDFSTESGGTAIVARLDIFNLDFGKPEIKKKIKDITVHLRPEADTDLTFAWSIDDNAKQTELVDQLGVHVPLNTFLLDTDLLADKNILLISKTNLRGVTEGYVISFSLRKTAKSQSIEIYRIIFDIDFFGSERPWPMQLGVAV